MVTTQFSLSLELSRLLPVSFVADKAVQYVMSFARDLQSSGSDIIVEQDLAEVFGLLHVVDNVASSFRTKMSIPPESHGLIPGLDLMTGPGPTIARALSKDQRPYLYTVLQSSFLVTIHETSSLAAALADYFNKRAEDAVLTQHLRAVPSSDSIHGMLRACEDQSTRYDWKGQLLATANILGLGQDSIHETLPPIVLHGLLTSLPLVQHFPEDRYVIVKSPRAACAIVTWLYTILGIPLLVSFHDDHDSSRREIRFPPDDAVTEQVLVDICPYKKPRHPNEGPVQRDPSVLLQSTDAHDKLFKWKASPDDEVIDATYTRPAKGLGRSILERETPHLQNRDRVIDEMRLVACAFAMRAAERLHMHRGIPEYDDVVDGGEGFLETSLTGFDDRTTFDQPDPMPYVVNEGQIMRAFSFIFDYSIRKFDGKTIGDYVKLYSYKTFYNIEEAPSCIERIFQDWGRDKKWTEESSVWPRLRLVAMQLSILILAFAHVSDLEACSNMPLCELNNLVAKSAVSMTLSAWDGQTALCIKEDAWFEVIALMMVGHTSDRLELDETCLLSSHGWSVLVSTFGDGDPYYTQPGVVSIRQGVPWRNSIWKHRVVDGPRNARHQMVWRKVASSGEKATLSCTIPVKRGSPLIGERRDSFVITLRLLHRAVAAIGLQANDSHVSYATPDVVRRSGYNELWSALWMVQKTLPCQHQCRLGEALTLEPGWTTLTGYGDHDSLEEYGPVRICLTADNGAARWRSLLSIAERRGLGNEVTFLRGADCCFRCAVVQAAKGSSAGCYVVL